MNSILATEKGLPPGLWLPLPEESTDQYLAENMDGPRLSPEDVVEYGTFVVALICFDVAAGNRVSTMPLKTDFDELRAAGYGISSQTLRRYHGGLLALQSTLGYFPDQFKPTKEAVMKRLGWVGEYAYERDEGVALHDVEGITFADVVRWGAKRDYLPAYNTTYSLFDGDTTEARRLLNLERAPTVVNRTFHALYKLGAQIIAENGGPVDYDTFRTRYNDSLESGAANTALIEKFKTHTRFWMEFDYIPTSSGLDAATLLNLGIKHAIRNNGHILNGGDITRLSREKRFPSLFPIKKVFGGKVTTYQAEVAAGYEKHLAQARRLEARGVHPRIVAAIGHNHVFTGKLPAQLRRKSSLLERLGSNESKLRFMEGILRNGFELLDDGLFAIQMEDLSKLLDKLELGNKEKHFVFQLIPRIDADEAMDIAA